MKTGTKQKVFIVSGFLLLSLLLMKFVEFPLKEFSYEPMLGDGYGGTGSSPLGYKDGVLGYHQHINYPNFLINFLFWVIVLLLLYFSYSKITSKRLKRH